ncbi:DUF1349 domain-containing protein [Chromobacterium violaceum]|uniref:DUF1349 domain-containing protein n=1 Tax=Chromobacterium violaceum TaxID=536 RepID=UPI000E1A1C2F|nr:DUF1349 domain-containing protein [Chromobacterium violaceum]MBA8736058.1 DUF1349 domain-containing protein [Chromobacterium violaceum]SUX35471.1 Uncharacterized conserved protein [Chromobacterium violaceum]
MVDRLLGETMARHQETALRICGLSFEARGCVSSQYRDGVLLLAGGPGSDGFNIPGLHQADRLGTLLAEVAGPFTLSAQVEVASRDKFDAAGLFIDTGKHRMKFGVEDYGAGGKKLVSVHSAPYSDEANGIDVGAGSVGLFVTRNENVFSCYFRTRDGRTAFHRAFYAEGCPDLIRIGFCVQAPFSEGAQGRFAEIAFSDTGMEHSRG